MDLMDTSKLLILSKIKYNPQPLFLLEFVGSLNPYYLGQTKTFIFHVFSWRFLKVLFFEGMVPRELGGVDSKRSVLGI